MLRRAIEWARAFDFEGKLDGGELRIDAGGHVVVERVFDQPQRVERKIAGLVDLDGQHVSVRRRAGAGADAL